jgi:hypothetical protein
LPIFYTQLDGLGHLWVRESGNLEVRSFVGFSEPDDTLKLRVDDKRVSI